MTKSRVREKSKMASRPSSSLPSSPSPHFVLFPFMSQGHTIPLLRLAHLLHYRGVSVTIFTTPANSPPIRRYFANTTVSVVILPFPAAVPGIPPGVENTEKLPSFSLFATFASATKLMQLDFERALAALPAVDCLISDGFLGWTRPSAAKLGIPRVASFGISNFSMTVCHIISQDRPHIGVADDDPFLLPHFPSLKITRNDIERPFCDDKPAGEFFEFVVEQWGELFKSQGLIINSAYELEPRFHEYWNQNVGPTAWCVGPLCLVDTNKPQEINPKKIEKPKWADWLDDKLHEGKPVLYVAFGTQAEMPPEQLFEIAEGLERTEVSFLWVLRNKGLRFTEGFEERVGGRGMVVKEWVDQMEVLRHQSIRGFLSHCGWNSVTESICSGVPILAMPQMAEQHLNARMVVEEMGVGLRVRPRNGSVRGCVAAEEVERRVSQLMRGEEGKAVRKRVEEVRKVACDAMELAGSSSVALERFIDEFCAKRRGHFALG
ncbi:UDP-glycosyltransferase 90A1-like [Malania oleifera]|uniref:UDP-glycosyltransferase 90A1-like n=1 Tax=Malania oleifera TaxID=397392 RepID=UPI0025AE011F|nr:UDP-glycosyltransferase 90A1-like [Malania oleifera]